MENENWWKILWRPLSVAASWLSESFRPLSLINILISTDGYHKQTGIRYGRLERQKLDIYLPKGTSRNLPVVVFFYGGSWQSGRRRDYGFVAEALTARGLAAVIPDYRVYFEARFPVFIQDGALAVSWIKNNISEFGGDASRLFLMGHSAGAYIAAMLALNPSYLEQVDISANELQGFIGLAGPYDFLPLKSFKLIDIFGGSHDIPETQPINFVRANTPPALLLHGASDRLVRPQNTEHLAQRLREAGARIRASIYPDIKHIRLLVSLATPFQNGAPVMEDIVHFLDYQG